ncbi:2-polyprenyl-6-methoxyphenol hydroxylase [Litoreibacter ascidiaceicola]|uniref:2-polyprenyl-6-methoxyphenol hydroxylase n=1 Tax=Litoreibacter ascidiaceicola TaxID=1486859 RepID=A0A1M4XXF3_9RHOB|nr:NAD(P)/FAD-dependent oxidoreductase [Litoreibacter ascidiaceicola]SHE98237.1 2-polyprenyl-6-methoxyphenol hydroxylase [Litoreibacter ascidiaceicola]
MSYNIAIAGAGIGGLTAAALLARQGHTITVFDQFDTPRPVGSGLVIQPVGQAVLDEIGAGGAARAKGNAVRRMLGHEADSGRRVLDVTYDHDPNGLHVGLAIHRAALFDAILQSALIVGVTIKPSHEVTALKDRHLHFRSNDPQGPFDLVIDSSGASSPLSPIQAKPLPYGAIWGTVPWCECGLPQDQLTQVYRRADRMIGIMPSGTLPGSDIQQAAVFWSMPRDAHDAWRAAPLSDWQAKVAQLWPQAAPIFEQITSHEQMTMARYAHGTLRKPYADNLAIIGDAAHKASPQLGQGANMAMLDASALAKAIAQHPLQDALPAYAMARRWHVRIYQAMSWAFTPQYQSDSRILPAFRDHLLFPVSQFGPVPRVLTRLVRGDMIPPMASLTPRD